MKSQTPFSPASCFLAQWLASLANVLVGPIPTHTAKPNQSAILAIDMKNWGRRADRLIGRRLREVAPSKTQIVEAALQVTIAAQRKAIIRAQFVERSLGSKTVLPIYLNLCGHRSGGQETLDGREVRFFNLFVAETDGEGWTRYALNREFMSLIDSVCWKATDV